MKLGCIGLGHMGQGMAARLLQMGHEVTVYDRTAAKAEGLRQRGAKVAGRMSEACDGDAVLTMVSDDAALPRAREWITQPVAAGCLDCQSFHAFLASVNWSEGNGWTERGIRVT